MDTSLEDLIRKRAHEIYIKRTQSELWDYGRKGTQDGDWSQAESEVGLEYGLKKSYYK